MVDHGPSGDASASVISWSPDQEILVCVMLMLKHILSCPELLPDGMVSPIPVTLDILFVLKNMWFLPLLGDQLLPQSLLLILQPFAGGLSPLGAQLGLLWAEESTKPSPLLHPKIWLVCDEDPSFCLGSQPVSLGFLLMSVGWIRSPGLGAVCYPPSTKPSFLPGIAPWLSFGKILSQEAPSSTSSQNGLLLGGPTSFADNPVRLPCLAHLIPPLARLPPSN